MNIDGGKAATGHANHGSAETLENSANTKAEDHSIMETRLAVSKDFQNQLNNVFQKYIDLKDGLANDNASIAQKSATELLKLIGKVDMKLLKDKESHTIWMAIEKELTNSAEIISKKSEIKAQREQFIVLSKNITKSVELFGINKKVYKQFCPMANNDKGAIWLSNEEKIMNPYFGASMLQCGSITAIIE
jgi:Cu(I)/Ag(I) efflux system membrane fusion protein